MKTKLEKIKSIIDSSSIEGVTIMSKIKYMHLLAIVAAYNNRVLRRVAKEDPSKTLTTQDFDVFVNGCVLPIEVSLVEEFILPLYGTCKIYCIKKCKFYSQWIQERNGYKKYFKIMNWF